MTNKHQEEKLTESIFTPTKCQEEEKKTKILKKGLLWHKDDGILSRQGYSVITIIMDMMCFRWKEKVFLLTSDHIHCFKKTSLQGLAQTEDYLFRVRDGNINENI